MDARGWTTEELQSQKEVLQKTVSAFTETMHSVEDMLLELSEELVMRRWIADLLSEAAIPYADIDEEGMDAEEDFDVGPLPPYCLCGCYYWGMSPAGWF